MWAAWRRGLTTGFQTCNPTPKVIGTLFQRRQCSGRCVRAVYVSEAYVRPMRDFISIRSYQYIIVMVPKKQRFTSLLRISSIAFRFRFKRVLMQYGWIPHPEARYGRDWSDATEHVLFLPSCSVQITPRSVSDSVSVLPACTRLTREEGLGLAER